MMGRGAPERKSCVKVGLGGSHVPLEVRQANGKDTQRLDKAILSGTKRGQSRLSDRSKGKSLGPGTEGGIPTPYAPTQPNPSTRRGFATWDGAPWPVAALA